jgi:hypothetical protein
VLKSSGNCLVDVVYSKVKKATLVAWHIHIAKYESTRSSKGILRRLEEGHLVTVDFIPGKCGLKDLGVEVAGSIQIQHWNLKVNNGIQFHNSSLFQR